MRASRRIAVYSQRVNIEPVEITFVPTIINSETKNHGDYRPAEAYTSAAIHAGRSSSYTYIGWCGFDFDILSGKRIASATITVEDSGGNSKACPLGVGVSSTRSLAIAQSAVASTAASGTLTKNGSLALDITAELSEALASSAALYLYFGAINSTTSTYKILPIANILLSVSYY